MSSSPAGAASACAFQVVGRRQHQRLFGGASLLVDALAKALGFGAEGANSRVDQFDSGILGITGFFNIFECGVNVALFVALQFIFVFLSFSWFDG